MRAKKRRKKPVDTAKFARGSLEQFHEAALAETNSSLLFVSDVNGRYFFQFVGLHTRLDDRSMKSRVNGRGREEKEDNTTLKMRELVSRTSQIAPAPSRCRIQENMVTVFAKEK